MMRHIRFLSPLAGLLTALVAPLAAQVLITNPTFTITDAADSTNDGVTFRNTTTAIKDFTAGGTLYTTGSTADRAYVRRNGTNDRSSVWYRGATGTGTPFLGTHSDDYGDLLLGNNINRGSDNTFSNSTIPNGNVAATGNIERLDFVWHDGIVAYSDFAVGVFDRGDVNAHDGFRIALITGWDEDNSRPSSYSTLLAQNVNWGSTNFNIPTSGSTTFGYSLFRYNTGDDLSANVRRNETGTQGVSGILFDLAAFGVAPGTKIYGYSLFGYDVDPSAPGLNLLEWTTYPTNTTEATGTGGIDLLAINGIAFSAVPEPSAFGLAALLALAASSTLRRRPRAPSLSS
jgi:hypothetical protein